MSESPSLGLPLLAAEQAQKHVTMNEALWLVDGVVQLSVKDRDLAAPPASPAEGDRYVVAAGATGAWAGNSGQIALRLNGGWAFRPPREGWRCWIEDEDVLLIFDGSAWEELAGTPDELQNLSLLGVATTADATNPFSAKLNKALWTAKTAGEGGDGDLRYTMNKETPADVLSLLLQTGFSGRAEIGLIGNDDTVFKVSPDGSAWTEALRLDKAAGNASFVGGTVRVTTNGLGIADDPDSVFRLTVKNNSGLLAAAFKGAAAGSQLQTWACVNGSGGPFFVLRKARGTPDAPANIAANDSAGSFTFVAYASANWRNVGSFAASCVAAAPSSSDMEGRLVYTLCAAGSASETEILRLQHATGLSMFGANPVIDQNRHHRLRSYTIATLPAATAPPGQMIYCSDLGGGGGQLVSDGTSWRRASRSGQQAVATDAAFTLTTLTSAERQKHTGTLTANRVVTLSTTNAFTGSLFHVTRTGAGAFNLDIGGLKNLTQNTWCEVVYDGSAWYVAAYGTL